ncbi:hypothetical protein [Helicobacter pylori]|uniref:hypothetical protein n=1 Tax=Helicobacter pylori TaxID=210 RepID=UPI0031455C87
MNNGRGCATLGDLYDDGKGVEKDLTKATYFYSKACKLGDRKACEIFSLEVLCRLSDLKACGMSYDKRKALGF